MKIEIQERDINMRLFVDSQGRVFGQFFILGIGSVGVSVSFYQDWEGREVVLIFC